MARLGRKSAANVIEEPAIPEDKPAYMYCSSSPLATDGCGFKVPMLSLDQKDYKPVMEQLLVAYGMPAVSYSDCCTSTAIFCCQAALDT